MSFWKWMFRSDPNLMVAAQLGAFGDEAKKEADEVANENAVAMLFMLGILIGGGIAYLVYQSLGISL